MYYSGSRIRDILVLKQFITQGCTNATEAMLKVSPHLKRESAWVQASRVLRRVRENDVLVSELAGIMTADEVKLGLSNLARGGKSEQTQLGALNTLARVHALLVDKSENVNKNIDLQPDLSGVPEKALQDELLKRLSLSAAGVATTQNPQQTEQST